MAKVGENTEVTLDLKTLGMVAAGVGSMVAMWFSLQSEISLAKELPKPNDPEITRMAVSYTHLTLPTILRV